MATIRTARDEAEAYLANPRFHQSLKLPACDEHNEMVLSYAEYGIPGDATTPTILFTPGMFGSRYIGVFMHEIAARHKVRMLVVDRFGFAKTPNEPLESRVKTWTAVVPKFLQALQIQRVALMSHSAGTIYNLNLLWHHPEILHPTRPQVFFFAPSVDVARSKVPMLLALQGLPGLSFAHWNKLASFFALRGSVMLGFSSGLLTHFAKTITPGTSEPSYKEEYMATIERDFGLTVKVQEELERAVLRGIFGEETVGANLEAMNCLKKGPEGLWAEADDMAVLIDKIAARARANRLEGQSRLGVGIFFGETDAMTGRAGQEYFQSCWMGDNGQYDDCFDVKVTTIAKSDHDSVLRSVEVFSEVANLVGETSV